MDYLTHPPPEEPLGTRGITKGIVKRWLRDKGHGAIASDATAPWDIWCHFSHIKIGGFKELTVGQVVEVEYERALQDSFYYRAISVVPTK